MSPGRRLCFMMTTVKTRSALQFYLSRPFRDGTKAAGRALHTSVWVCGLMQTGNIIISSLNIQETLNEWQYIRWQRENKRSRSWRIIGGVCSSAQLHGALRRASAHQFSCPLCRFTVWVQPRRSHGFSCGRIFQQNRLNRGIKRHTGSVNNYLANMAEHSATKGPDISPKSRSAQRSLYSSDSTWKTKLFCSCLLTRSSQGAMIMKNTWSI